MRYPLLDTFLLSHPKRQEVENAFGLSFRKVEYEAFGPLGNCYWNVEDVVEQRGGRAVHGWLILTWPGLYVEAMHHAVWQRPDGTLMDITRKYPTDLRSFSVFSPSDQEPVNLSQPSFIPNKFFILKDSRAVRHLRDFSKESLDARRALITDVMEAGGGWLPRSGLQLPPHLAHQFKGRLMQVDSNLDVMSAAFVECAKSQRKA